MTRDEISIYNEDIVYLNAYTEWLESMIQSNAIELRERLYKEVEENYKYKHLKLEEE